MKKLDDVLNDFARGLREAKIAYGRSRPDQVEHRPSPGLGVEVRENRSWARYSKEWHWKYGPARWKTVHWSVGEDVLRAWDRGARWCLIRQGKEDLFVLARPIGDGKVLRTYAVRKGPGADRKILPICLASIGRSMGIGTDPDHALVDAFQREIRRDRKKYQVLTLLPKNRSKTPLRVLDLK